MSKTALRFKNMTVGKQQNELARFRVLGGPDNGVVFVMTGNRVSVGRGPENDIILTDIKASRRHFEVSFNMGIAVLRDAGSQHGVLINGAQQKQATLRTGDKVGIGETVLEFINNELGSTQMIVRPPMNTTSQVGTGTSGLTQFIQRPNSGTGSSLPPNSTVMQKTPTFIERNKKFLLILGALMAIATLLPEVEQKQRKTKNKYLDPNQFDAERSISALAPPVSDPNATKASDQYFKEGFREYRARNYLRAQVAFETALQVWPDHPLAKVYLDSTKKGMQDEATDHMKAAKRDEEAYRLKDAFMRYDSVKRLYAKDQSNPLYKEAEEQAATLEKKLKEAEKTH
jgi:pSer/pThr/pTyr-binding forkhead associated (FHA) protein